VFDQSPQGVGHFLFRTDNVIDAEMLGQKARFQPEESLDEYVRYASAH